MEKRLVVLYGNSIILGTLGASLRHYPHLEVIPLIEPFPTGLELEAMDPDVIIFDLEATHPEGLFSLLESRPGLSLIGVDPDSHQVLIWSGRHLQELSTQDLVEVIDSISSNNNR